MNIIKLCYELYKIEWKQSHGITVEVEMDSIKNYYKHMIGDDTEYTYNDYLEDVGYNGAIYACFVEFILIEYLDEEYIKSLLNNKELICAYKTDLSTTKTYAKWMDHKVIGYANLSEQQKNELNKIKLNGLYFGFDKKTYPETVAVERILSAVDDALTKYYPENVDVVYDEENGKVQIMYHDKFNSYPIEPLEIYIEVIKDLEGLEKELDKRDVGHVW